MPLPRFPLTVVKLYSIRYKIEPDNVPKPDPLFDDRFRDPAPDPTTADIEVFSGGRVNGDLHRGPVVVRFAQASADDLRAAAKSMSEIADSIERDSARLQ